MAGSIDYRVELEKALSSSTRLQPIHVEIVNDSTWYYMRNRLGPKRQSFYNIKYNEAHLYYEGYIYQMARREEDLKVVPKKVMVGHAADKWKAYKLCEKAIKERDSDVKSITMDMMERNIKVNLETHYRILVVSNSFIRVPPIERVAIVCEELLSALGSTPSLMATDISEMVPSRFRHVSTFGPNVLSLNLFTFLRNPGPKEVMLQIKAITPSQWKPSVYPAILSERLGKDHQHVATLGVPNAAKPPQQKRRVQKLTTSLSTSALPSAAPPTIVTVGDSKNGSVVSSLHSVASDDMSTALSVSEASESLPSDMQLQPELAETLGLHESISGVRYAKLGGIYGHFFNDLSQDVRAMVLERYQSNKHLIRLETHADPNVARDITAIPLEEEPSFKPKTNLSVMRAKAQVEANLLPPDRGTTNQEQMREEVLLSSRKIELLAIRLQRIRRIHATFKARRRIWWRYWACITLQRVVRGWFARRFVHLYRKLQPIAVRRIQTFYRNLRTNRVLYAWQMIAYRLTRVALRIIKRFFHKCYLSW